MEHNNQIAYHPIRVSPHASLFLPYSPQELQVYQRESLNTLRVQSSPSSYLSVNNHNHPRDSYATNHHIENDVGTCTNTNLESNSPADYTTPSPFSIPPESSSSRTYDCNEYYPFHDVTTSSNNKRSHKDSTKDYRSSTPLVFPHSLSTCLELSDRTNKRPRYDQSSGRLAQSNSEVSISEKVAQHYNSRPNLTKGARTESPIFGLRKLNNWIKSVIIGKFASVESNTIGPLLRSQTNNSIYGKMIGTKILELGCGKGGDLAKWQNAGVRELYGFDIARVSVEQAQSRYMQGCQKKFYAKFVALDCFALPIASVLSPEELREPFHAVSLQFCMHYAFESEAKVRTMMENVSNFLIQGGVMIGTIPDPDLLLQNWERCSNDSNQDEPTFGNSVYQITFPYRLTPDKQIDQVYSNRYSFYLQDAVENVPEYLVLWEPFVEMAREYGLRLIYKQGFHEIVENEKFEPNFNYLLSKMNLINQDRNLLISNDHWEACGIYLAFAFIKD